MKIAVLGNMNNNGFAIMRYLRDLGADAHLLLYANDGVGSLAHFRPEDDTWDYPRWAPYIHRTPISNSLYGGLTGASVVFNFLQAVRAAFRKTGDWSLHWLSTKALHKALGGYDAYIACGIAPALFARLDKTLDIFYPYSTGVEHLGTPALKARLSSMGPIKKVITLMAADNQRRGLKSVKHILNAEFSLTNDVLMEACVEFKPLPIPMVYREPAGDASIYSNALKQVLRAVGDHKFILSTARQVWVKPEGIEDAIWLRVSKHSDWLIRAYAKLREQRKTNLKLVLAEYGQDVEATMALCCDLRINDQTLWMPKLSRRELAVVTNRALAVAGEFKLVNEMIWGGSGWEALAASKPLLHSFRFMPGRYEELYGIPRPPVLAVNSEADMYAHLVDLSEKPAYVGQLGAESGAWFDHYNGAGLAAQWLGLVEGSA